MANNEIDFPRAIDYEEAEYMLARLTTECEVSYTLTLDKDIQRPTRKAVVTSAELEGTIAKEIGGVRLERKFTFNGPEEGAMFDQMFFPTPEGNAAGSPRDEAPIWDLTRKLVAQYFEMDDYLSE